MRSDRLTPSEYAAAGFADGDAVGEPPDCRDQFIDEQCWHVAVRTGRGHLWDCLSDTERAMLAGAYWAGYCNGVAARANERG